MARKRYSDEDVLNLLRQIELSLASVSSVEAACRSAGISDATYYNWRKRYGGMGKSQLQGSNPARLQSRVIRLSSALIALTHATCALDRLPCLVCAAMDLALPSGVRGPVDLPPCNLQRLRSLLAGFWHAAAPARVFAPHLRPGQSGPKRVAMPAWASFS